MEYGLSLGSNQGNRLQNIKTAIALIADLDNVNIVAEASVYETMPVDVKIEYKDLLFLNTILIIETNLLPDVLHKELIRIESELGRVRGKDQNAPRPIDIDIIYAGDIVSDDPALTLPHLRWAERRFVVEPLAEVRPGLIINADKGTVKDVLLSLPEERNVESAHRANATGMDSTFLS